MRVNNNTAAYNVWANYSVNYQGMKNTMKRLSTGTIRTVDSPASVGISERMRAQIKGNESAVSNVDRAVSTLQTADSWIQKIEDMLSQMKSLAVTAQNPTGDADLESLQTEFGSLQDEITRITSGDTAAATFNGLKLFQGGAQSYQVGEAQGQKIGISFSDLSNKSTEALDSKKINLQAEITAATSLTTYDTMSTTDKVLAYQYDSTTGVYTKLSANPTAKDATKFVSANVTFSLVANGTNWDLTDGTSNILTGASADDVASYLNGVSAYKKGSSTLEEKTWAATDITAAATGFAAKISVTNVKDTKKIEAAYDYAALTADQKASMAVVSEDGKTKTMVKDMTSDEYSTALTQNNASLYNAAELNVNWTDIINSKTGIEVDDEATLTALQGAIDFVAVARADYATQQKRMENVKEALTYYNDNLTDAESQIRDIDSVKETTALAKYQVMTNTSISVLAQANSMTQNITQLL